jgi:pimeloyl-ACP methyl ester carboxylesterase
MFYLVQPKEKNKLPIRLVFIHGWGSSYQAFSTLAEYFSDVAECVLLDLPGFGKSDEPKAPMSPANYAEEVAKIIAEMPKKKTIVVGHSFGARVAIHLCNLHKKSVDGLVFLAGAGLKKKRSLRFRIKAFCMKKAARFVRRFPFFSFLKKMPMGSRDYREATPVMRGVLVMAVNEDLAELAKNVACPALLIYGSDDNETPSEFGRRYQGLMRDAKFFEIKGENHFSILDSPVAQNLIEEFLKARFKC